eukprot:CAMPEP_0119042664 /NCGR_PEP_ID=MMETSP1177-20130426/16066_1 /TAXON_ID=2985 /ORGANISM="Ochromonas sp, Strain CCMP1899" /LENGTH=135 /DNA_ID=CAMNT_0007009613 /DNA_START=233 /DNA_END=640 /DNA_ORIENTATION=+
MTQSSTKGILKSSSALSFNKAGGGDDGSSKTTKSKIIEERKTPLPDTGNRYHIRIKALNGIQERHVITRLMRYFPDLTWETASDIVETAFVNEIALVRVVNNLDEATLAIDMLRKADPPIPAEIWDSKIEEVLVI